MKKIHRKLKIEQGEPTKTARRVVCAQLATPVYLLCYTTYMIYNKRNKKVDIKFSAHDAFLE
jgi:hypothetical protein